MTSRALADNREGCWRILVGVDLTGAPLLVLLAVLAIALPTAAVLTWDRVAGPRAAKVAQRVGLVVGAQLAAVLLAGAAVNDQFSLYESWSDLFGTDPTAVGPATAAGGQGADGGATGAGAGGVAALGASSPDASVAAAGLPGSGRVRVVSATGPASGISSRFWVLLPADYDSPGSASKRYPVVEFFPGYPGTPTTWLHALQLQTVMDAEVSAGRVPPFVAVLPTMNVAAPRDTECVDVAGGPKVATWLAVDVPKIVSERVRTLPPGKAWGLTGYSTGGFCAAKLVLQYPQAFGASAVLAGYFSPSHDVTTGDLFGGSTELEHANDPQWIVTHQTPPAVHMLTVYSDQDPETFGPTKAFIAAAKPPLSVDEIVLAKGGHNTGVWLAVEPQVLRWLGKHLATS